MSNSTQTQRLIDAINVDGTKSVRGMPVDGVCTKQVKVPADDMVIQTVIRKPVNDTILLSEVTVQDEIRALHATGRDAYIILMAPTELDKVSSAVDFSNAHDSGYKRLVVCANELERAGLSDKGQIHRDLDALRNNPVESQTQEGYAAFGL